MGLGGQHHALAALPREGVLVPIVQEAEWDAVPIWMSVEKRKSLFPTTVQTSNRPSCSKSLHWLCYPTPFLSDKFLDIRFVIEICK